MPSNSINAEEADAERSMKTYKTFWNYHPKKMSFSL